MVLVLTPDVPALSNAQIFDGIDLVKIGYNFVSVSRTPREKEPGLMIGTYTEAMQKRIRGARS